MSCEAELINDTKVCPHQGLHDATYTQQAEEKRILQVIAKHPPKNHGYARLFMERLQGKYDDTNMMHIWLEGFPATISRPLILHVDDKQVFHSGRFEGLVNEHFNVHVPENCTDVAVKLDFGVYNFHETMDIDLTQGRFLLLRKNLHEIEKHQWVLPLQDKTP